MMDVILLVDPELALPDDGIPDGIKIVAHGNYGGEYHSLMALIRDRDGIEIRLDRLVTPAQRAVEPEAWVARRVALPDGELTIYGHLVTHDQAADRERRAGSQPPEVARWRHRLDNALGRGWLYGWFFSPKVPNGEPGVIHRAMIGTTLTREQFEDAGTSGWPPIVWP